MNRGQAPPAAWQPFTPRGLVAFARARLGRLLFVQFLVGLLAAGAFVWVLDSAFLPTLREAIRRLPASGQIHDGTLRWPGDSPTLLAEGHFLAVVVDIDHIGTIRSPAQFQVEFGAHTLRLFSLAGFSELPYPPGAIIPFNRPDLEPWWGAWEPAVLWAAYGGALLGCLASWAILATLYFFPAWLAAFFGNRDLNLRGCWKLAGAALMPGAMLMIAVLVCYGLGALDIVELAAAFVLHLAVGWICLALALFKAPKISAPGRKKNPFAANVKKPAR